MTGNSDRCRRTCVSGLLVRVVMCGRSSALLSGLCVENCLCLSGDECQSV